MAKADVESDLVQREWCETVLQSCSVLRDCQLFCDLTLLSSEQTEFPVHSVIIAAASPVIKNLVVKNDTTLSFPDISHGVWKCLIDLIYTGSVEIYDSVTLTSLQKAVDLLELHPNLRKVINDAFVNEKSQSDLDDTEDNLDITENAQVDDSTAEPEISFTVTSDEPIKKKTGITNQDQFPSDSRNHPTKASGEYNQKEVMNKPRPRRSKRKGSFAKTFEAFVSRSPVKKTKVDVEKTQPGNSEKNGKVEKLRETRSKDDVKEDAEEEMDKDIVDDDSQVTTSNEEETPDNTTNSDAKIQKQQTTELNGSHKQPQKTASSRKLRAPKDVIAVMRQLERKAKKKQRVRSQLLKDLSESTIEVTDDHLKDVLVRCMYCELGACQAEYVKCLLCLERVPNTTVIDHLTTDHPFFSHKVCWVSCKCKTVISTMCDKRDRIIAKKLYVPKQHRENGNVDSHDEIDVYKCSLCDTCIDSLSAVRVHMKECHDFSAVHVCESCGDVYKNPGSKREHKHYCDGGSPLKCDVCHTLLDSFKSLWTHMNSKHYILIKTIAKGGHCSNINQNSAQEKSVQAEVVHDKSNMEKGRTREDGDFDVRCISCGDRCVKEVINCLLCASNVTRAQFADHITEFHSHSPTSVYWYRCKFVYRRNSKVKADGEDRVVGRQVMLDTFDEQVEMDKDAKPNSLINFLCTICGQICKGVITFGKHCRFDHTIKTVLVCKYCKDVFRSVTMRDKHQYYCGNGSHSDKHGDVSQQEIKKSDSLSQEDEEKQQSESDKQEDLPDEVMDMKWFLKSYCSSEIEVKLEFVPKIDSGKIAADASQNSRCLKCATKANKDECIADTLRCYLCFEQVIADQLDAHLAAYHRHLQGSQCFACNSKARPLKHESIVIGFHTENAHGKIADLPADVERDGAIVEAERKVTIYVCTACGEKCRTLQQFAKHTSQSHSISELYCCKVCPLVFTSKQHRDDHEFFCTGHAAPYCHECSELFPSLVLYRKHCSAKHAQRKKVRLLQDVMIKCPYCDDYQKRGEDRYRNHLRTIHKKQRFFLCKTCFLTFDYAHIRDDHVHKQHRPNQMPLCSECGQTFPTPCKLYRHINYWHKEGRVKEKLKRSNVPLKMCDHCGKGFKLLANLNDHVNRYHLHFKPYKCCYCDKAFYHTFARKKHEFKDHGAGYYECSQCGHRVYSRWDLKKHEERVHGLVRGVSDMTFTPGQGQQITPVMFERIAGDKVMKIPQLIVNEAEMRVHTVSLQAERREGGSEGGPANQMAANWLPEEGVFYVRTEDGGYKKVIIDTEAGQGKEGSEIQQEAVFVNEGYGPEVEGQNYQIVSSSSSSQQHGDQQAAEGQQLVAVTAGDDEQQVVAVAVENQEDEEQLQVLAVPNIQMQNQPGEVYTIVSDQVHGQPQEPIILRQVSEAEHSMGSEQAQQSIVSVKGEEQLVDWQQSQGQDTLEPGQQIVYVLQQ